MSQPGHTLEQIFEKQVRTLSLTLQPFTVVKYQYVARYFVGYLRETFPEVRRLSQLRRDPHMLGWFRWLCECGHLLVTIPATNACSVFADCSMTWPSRAIPSSRALSCPRTFRHARNISPEPCLRKTIDDSRRNCAGQTPCIPMLSC
jgi:hypothetical protein